MSSVYFDPAVGGDGSTVTDDSSPTTGLANDGHRTRFVPALSQVVAVAGNTVTQTTLAKNWATKTDGLVDTDYSAKYYATVVGKNWATKTDGLVDTDYSAKYYATIVGKNWATKTDGPVDTEYSAKYYALSALNAPGTNATSSTSLTIGTGSKSFTIQTGKAYVVGMSVKIAETATPTNWMHGDITAYDSGTGAMTVSVSSTNGSATASAWTISLSAALPNVIGIAQGGTGQTTANAALNALLPSQTGNTGLFLQTNGTNTSWAEVVGVSLSKAALHFLTNS